MATNAEIQTAAGKTADSRIQVFIDGSEKPLEAMTAFNPGQLMRTVRAPGRGRTPVAKFVTGYEPTIRLEFQETDLAALRMLIGLDETSGDPTAIGSEPTRHKIAIHHVESANDDNDILISDGIFDASSFAYGERDGTRIFTIDVACMTPAAGTDQHPFKLGDRATFFGA